MGVPPDPICSICSKAIPSGSLVLLEQGELYHLRCRTQTLELAAMEEVARARGTQQRATQLREDVRRRRANRAQAARLIRDIRGQPIARTRPERAARKPAQTGVCPLCGGSATLTDWRPALEWLVVEGCGCLGYRIWADLVEERLPRLSAADRADLARRIRTFRAMGHEAWCTSSDRTPEGPLVVRRGRLEQPT